MSQPMHLRAPAAHATGRIAPRPASSSLLDAWPALAPLAMSIIVLAAHHWHRRFRPRLINSLPARLLPAHTV